METKKVYQFDDKKIYKRTLTLDASDKSASGAWNIPFDCVEVAPPAPQENTAYKWQGGAWVAVEDYRKKEYWLPGDTYGTPGREVKEIGPLPEGAMLTPPEQTIDEVKVIKKSVLKAERDQKEVLPIEYNGNSFDYDDKARDRINAAIIALDMAGAEVTLQWTTADNTNATVTAQDLRNIIAAVAMRSNTLHEQYRVAKEVVNAAETKEEVEAVTLEGNADV